MEMEFKLTRNETVKNQKVMDDVTMDDVTVDDVTSRPQGFSDPYFMVPVT